MEQLRLQSNNSNQIVKFNYDDNYFEFHIFTFRGFTFVDITLNGNPLIYGLRCSANVNLIPQQTQFKLGNFRFKCLDGEYPYYTEFNKSQTLEFYTIEELGSL